MVFRPYVPGRPWSAGTAIVFHDLRDIEENFADFYNLMSRSAVVAGSLVEAFEHMERTTTQLFTVLEMLPDPDRELVRNKIWPKIARIVGPLLTDQSENPAAQLEVIEHCYVTTPVAQQTDEALDALLKDLPQPYLVDAQVVDLRPGLKGKTAFSHRLQADIQAARPGAYILTGGVGSGKTTFLRRFANLVDRDFVQQYTVWLHVDFLPIGNLDATTFATELRAHAYRSMRSQIDNRYRDELASTGEKIRNLFDEEIKQAELTSLFGVAAQSDEWNRQVNELTQRLFADDERYTSAALRKLRKRGLRVAVVLDNTDQLGELFQEHVFLFAQKLSADYGALCVVALREEKFFAAYRRGIFDAFGTRRFHIGSPDLKRVLVKRLGYARDKFGKIQVDDTPDGTSADDARRIDAFFRAVIGSAANHRSPIVRMLASVSNGDMRYALDMFREFLSSGNTNVEKIIEVTEREGGYTIPFHEFAKSAVLGSRKHYRSSVSRIVNVFKKSDALGASHLTACRILARLAAAAETASAHGEGFVATSALLREYRTSFGYADDLLQWCGELLRRNLIESEPPRVPEAQKADAFRITAAGAYYWRYLVRSFAYIDLVFVDTPMSDKPLVAELAEMADSTDLTIRFERARSFLTYLEKRESEELALSAERAGPFVEPLTAEIRRNIESEIRSISKRTGAKDLSHVA